MKRILLFLLTAVLLIGAAAPGEARAEEENVYNNIVKILDDLEITYSGTTWISNIKRELEEGYTNCLIIVQEYNSYFWLYLFKESSIRMEYSYYNQPRILMECDNGEQFYYNYISHYKSNCGYTSYKKTDFDYMSNDFQVLYSNFELPEVDNFDNAGKYKENFKFSPIYVFVSPTPSPIPTPSPTPTPTPTPLPSGTISLNIKDSTAKADYEISGGFESFYLELLSSETLDGTFTKLAVSRNFTSSGTGSYTFNNVLQPGSYYMANLLLSDNTLLAQSEKGYVVKDDAVVGLDISVSEDGTASGAYALSGGQAITADIFLQESKSGFAWDEWITVDTVSSVTGEGTAFAYAAKDYHYYRLYCEYVCTNDDGVDVSGTRYSAKVQRTLPPSPDLMEDSNDFFSMFIIMMLLMREFPLNLFLVAMVMLCAILVFSMLFKGGKNG